MKTLLSMLTAFAITVTPITSFTNVIKNTQQSDKLKTNTKLLIGNNKNNNVNSNELKLVAYSLEMGKSLEEYVKNDVILENQIKTLIEKSLKWKSGKIIINDYLFNEYSNASFYKIIFSDYFLDVINEMYKYGLLIYNQTSNNFQFLDTKTEELALNNSVYGVGQVWGVWHWYWFLYWELYCDHEFSQNVVYWATIGSDISYFLDVIAWYFPVLAPYAIFFATICIAAAMDFGHADRGNGVMIPWDGIIPRKFRSR